jgi:hypothetical protein
MTFELRGFLPAAVTSSDNAFNGYPAHLVRVKRYSMAKRQAGGKPNAIFAMAGRYSC